MSCTAGPLRALPLLRLTLVLAMATLVLGFWHAGDVHGSDDVPSAPNAEGRVSAEQHEDNGDGDSELPWLFAVFFITWAAFFGYVLFMSRRQREMRREIDALRRALEERQRRASGPEPDGE